MREYDQIAEWYVAARDARVGVADVAALARTLPPGATVVDLGSGDGTPISRTLLESGLDVVAVDSSAEMIARYDPTFRASVPGASGRRTYT